MTLTRLPLACAALLLCACASDPADDTTIAEDPAGTIEADVPDAGQVPTPSARLNLDTASEAEFMTIPGVGDNMAHEFEEYRPWTSVGQFRREIGKYIDDDQEVLDGYLEYVYVPIRLDGTDAETLMQLPGMSEAEARQLADGQPYASADEFLTAYEAISGEPDAEAARAFLSQ